MPTPIPELVTPLVQSLTMLGMEGLGQRENALIRIKHLLNISASPEATAQTILGWRITGDLLARIFDPSSARDRGYITAGLSSQDYVTQNQSVAVLKSWLASDVPEHIRAVLDDQALMNALFQFARDPNKYKSGDGREAVNALKALAPHTNEPSVGDLFKELHRKHAEYSRYRGFMRTIWEGLGKLVPDDNQAVEYLLYAAGRHFMYDQGEAAIRSLAPLYRTHPQVDAMFNEGLPSGSHLTKISMYPTPAYLLMTLAEESRRPPTAGDQPDFQLSPRVAASILARDVEADMNNLSELMKEDPEKGSIYRASYFRCVGLALQHVGEVVSERIAHLFLQKLLKSAAKFDYTRTETFWTFSAVDELLQAGPGIKANLGCVLVGIADEAPSWVSWCSGDLRPTNAPRGFMNALGLAICSDREVWPKIQSLLHGSPLTDAQKALLFGGLVKAIGRNGGINDTVRAALDGQYGSAAFIVTQYALNEQLLRHPRDSELLGFIPKLTEIS